jgi:folate-binding protein YgfZ
MSTPPVDVQASWPHFDLQRFEGALKLSHLGLIECAGTDASDFLQQQLTQEMLLLPAGSSCLAGFCNAKGRLQASMVVIKESQERLLLILPMDMLPRTIKRLSMFVLRAKVKLSDVSASHTVMGLMGESALGLFSNTPQVLQAHLQSALGLSRRLMCGPHAAFGDLIHERLQAHALTTELWFMSEVLSGVAWVEDAIFEQFVPQMLNFESAGAVSFKKGCYPGQEVVARSQFRGTLKRRTAIVFAKSPLHVGMELYGPIHATEPCANLIQVAKMGDFDVGLACFQVEALLLARDQDLPRPSIEAFFKLEPFWSHCFTQGPQASQPMALGFWPLPYSILDDI